MQVKALQSDVTVETDSISGKLAHVDTYTGFSSRSSEQSGNYLALRVDSNADEVTVVLKGGRKSSTVADSNGLVIVRVTDTAKQSIEITAKTENEVIKKTYNLKNLNLGS